ncbi:uncharacterized protein TRIADDRAFT_53250 [Trichoplax adhaerens]|uniref:PNPLA domain-containing protein n=1 Tax=Trichoplax adhaerens TaxID=10228 RepID=B3RNQ5_TRIAD|nr:predicted protein [Trichoplax adhaerens]EDV28053.1 predicted protein [Trichoplax adhaerens]|eukprot:XP_002109887.1 predicted protein [Trichoplax adhaerens]
MADKYSELLRLKWDEEEKIIKRQALTRLSSREEYGLEGLVFSGGGNQVIAYIGALEALSEIGLLWKVTNEAYNVKRFAGTGSGALLAALLAVGYDLDNVVEILDDRHLHSLISGTKKKLPSGYRDLPIIRRSNRWNNHRKATIFLKDQLQNGPILQGKLDDRSRGVTFKQLYSATKVQLCVVVTNLNRLDVQYFHPKTTPNVPIHVAVELSMTSQVKVNCPETRVYNNTRIALKYCNGELIIPNQIEPSKKSNHSTSPTQGTKRDSMEDIYIKGGLTCNYPLHAFDGWWLCMDKPKSTFEYKAKYEKLINTHDTKFRCIPGQDSKTLGFLLYSEDEPEIFEQSLMQRENFAFKSNLISELQHAYPTVSTKGQPAINERMDAYNKRLEYQKSIQTFRHLIQALQKLDDSKVRVIEEIYFHMDSVENKLIEIMSREDLDLLGCQSYRALIDRINYSKEDVMMQDDLIKFRGWVAKAFDSEKDSEFLSKLHQLHKELIRSHRQIQHIRGYRVKDVEMVLRELHHEELEILYSLCDCPEGLLKSENSTETDITMLMIRGICNQLKRYDEIITIRELLATLDRNDYYKESFLMGYQRREISHPDQVEYAITEDDLVRTVGINSYFIAPSESDLSTNVKRMLIKAKPK